MRFIIQHLVRRRPTRSMWGALPVLFVLFTLVLAACGSSGNTTTTSKFGGKLAVGLASDAVTLDPLKSTALVDRQVMLNLYDTLVRVDAQNNVQPELATSWQYPTPTQLVFTLRTDVKFTDGTPFNADAVVFNINRILKTPSSPRFSELATVKSATAIDASHVRFDLTKPFSPLLSTLTDRAGMMLSPAVVQKLGDTLGNGPTNAGSGPFMFSSWVKGDHLTITRNPHYWMKDAQGNALPYLNSVTYRGITNGTVEFTNLQTGNIDVADSVDPNSLGVAKSDPNLIYKQQPGLSFGGIELNTTVPPLNNVHVRRAVAWGINRDEILNTVLKGVGVVAQGPIPPSSWAFNKNFTPFHYDVNQAKAELQQAGMTSATFTLLTVSGSPLATQQAQIIQSELQPAGITVKIQEETFATLLSDTQAHHFQAAVLGWSGRPDPDGNMFSWFHTGGGNNNTLYSNAQVDSLLEGARTSSDQATRTQDYQQAEMQIVNDAPYVFITHGVSIQASSKKVQNFEILPTTIMDFTSVYLKS
ncbi:MAG TPA: ABC transporter substrate-binding protein [Ktedonobacteraceae bacterium]|nr:ABC transporter substrate-binding protein [Ktedonobacteraceae bacterium]